MTDDSSGDYSLDEPSAEDRAQASESNIQKMNKFVENFASKSGTMLHPCLLYTSPSPRDRG